MRPTPKRPQRGLATFVLLAALLGLPASLFLGAAYLATDEGADQQPVFQWDDGFRDALSGAFSFTDIDNVYLWYGRAVVPAMAAFTAALWLLGRTQGPAQGRAARASYHTVFALNVVLAAGALVAFFTPLIEYAYFAMFPAMLLGIPAAIVYGIVTIRGRHVPRDVGWWLAIGGATFLPLSQILGHNSIAMAGYFVFAIRMALIERAIVPRSSHASTVPRAASGAR